MTATPSCWSFECFVFVLLVLGFLAVTAVVGLIVVGLLRLWDGI